MPVKKIRNTLNSRPLLKSAAIMVSGSVVAQAISFVCTLATARLYNPDDFGILSFFTSLAGFIAIFASGRYDLAIVVEREEKEIVRLVRLCRNLILFFAVLASLVCSIVYVFREALHITKPYVEWLPFLGVAVFTSAFTHVLYMYFTRHKKYNVLSASRITESLALNGFTIGLYFLGAWGLLAGYILAQLVVVIYFAYLYQQHKVEKLSGSLTETAKKYSNFPRFNVLQGMLDMFQTQSIILLGSLWFETAILGFYSFAMRLLQVPMWLIVRPVSHLFFAEVSDLHRNGKPVWPLVKKTMLNAFILSLPVFAVIAAFGPWIFSLLFGAKWEMAGALARLLCAWMLVDLIRAPIAQLPVVLGKQKKMLGWTIIGFIISTISVILGSWLFHDKLFEAFSIIVAGQIIHCLLILVFCVKLAKNQSHGR